MKKVRMMMCLALTFVFAMAGCSEKGLFESEKWIEESAEKISDEITSGQFVIDDVIYQFPMPLTDWLDNGWHISKSYDNVDDFLLDPHYTSTDFELFNEEDQYVRVTVYNDSDEGKPVEDCIVYSLYMSLTEVDAVFPKGMTKRNNPEDVLAAYGEPDEEGDESNLLEATYFFEDKEMGQCMVELNVTEYSYVINPFTSISYSMIDPGDFWDTMVSKKGVEEAAKFYIDASMKASFYADFEDYVSYNMDSQEGAEELYDAEIAYFAEVLVYYLDITEEYATAEVMERLQKVAADVLAKVKWEVKSVDVNAFKEGTITLALYPTNFFYVAEEDIYAASEAYNTKYADVDFENMTYEEYDAMEIEYTEMMVKVLEDNVSAAGTLDAVEKVYEVDLDDVVLSPEDWENVDDIIMDLIEE